MKFKRYKVIRDGKDPEDMFRVRFKDGLVSEDFYNLTWAKEHTRLLTEYDIRSPSRMARIGPEKPAGAFK